MTKQQKIERQREVRSELKEPRDWEKLWWAYALHFLQGAVCGLLAVHAVKEGSDPMALLSLACVGQYGAYQGLSFARKHDTVGRDMADFGAGYAVGGVLYYLARLI